MWLGYNDIILSTRSSEVLRMEYVHVQIAWWLLGMESGCSDGLLALVSWDWWKFCIQDWNLVWYWYVTVVTIAGGGLETKL